MIEETLLCVSDTLTFQKPHPLIPSVHLCGRFTPSVLILNNVGCGWVSPVLSGKIPSACPLNSLSGHTLSLKHPFVLSSIPSPVNIQIILKSDFSPSAFPKKLDQDGDLPFYPTPTKTHVVWTCHSRNHTKISCTIPLFISLINTFVICLGLVCPVVAVSLNQWVPSCTANFEKKGVFSSLIPAVNNNVLLSDQRYLIRVLAYGHTKHQNWSGNAFSSHSTYV